LDRKKIPKESGEISRREFIRDAGLVVGGAAIGSTALLAACAPETETVTETTTETATQTETATITETVSKFICPYDGQEFNTLDALQAHLNSVHPDGVAPAKFALEYDPNKCTGCGACQYFCSTYHEGEASLALSRITMHRQIPDLLFSVETCRQCISPSCMSACLFEAMYVDEATGARVIDEKCNGCGLCALACPFNWDPYEDQPGGCVLKRRADTGKYFKCDLCAGRPGGPACVEACGWGALTVKEVM